MASLLDLEKKLRELFSQGAKTVGRTVNNINPLGDTNPQQAGRQNLWTEKAAPAAKKIVNNYTPFGDPTSNNGNNFWNERNPVAMTMAGRAQLPEFKLQGFADNIKNPVGKFGAQAGLGIAESFLNTPRNLVQGPINVARDVNTGKKPREILASAAPFAESMLNIGTLGGGTLVKGAIKQGLKQGVKEGIKRGAFQGAKYGGIYGGIEGVKSGRDLADPVAYRNNLAKSIAGGVGAGAVLGGATGGIPGMFRRNIKIAAKTTNPKATSAQIDQVTDRYIKDKMGKFIPKKDSFKVAGSGYSASRTTPFKQTHWSEKIDQELKDNFPQPGLSIKMVKSSSSGGGGASKLQIQKSTQQQYSKGLLQTQKDLPALTGRGQRSLGSQGLLKPSNDPSSMKIVSQKTSASQPTIADDVSTYISQQVKGQQLARQPLGVKEAIKGFKGDVKLKFVDETAAIGDTLGKAEKQNRFNVLPAKDIRIQIDKTLRSDSIASQFIKDKGFANVIKQVPDTDEFNQYLIAKHASTVGQRGIATGRDATRDKQLIQALSGKYEPYAQQVRAYQDALLDYKVESGFISRDLAKSLRKQYPDYVPLQRIFSELEEGTIRNTTGGGGVASVSTQNVLKRLKGSEREISNPLEGILEATGVAFKQGERNKAAQMLTSYKDLPGNPFGLRELSQKELSRGKYTVSVFINGKKRIFETLPEIAEAAKNLDTQQIGLIGQIFAVPTRVLRLGATGVNAPFIASNLVKDQISSSITSNKPLYTSLANPKVFGKALFEAIKHGDVYDDWVRSGGSFTSFDIYRNATPGTIAKIRSGRSLSSKIAYTARNPREWLKAVEDVVGRAEELTRIQQFEGTRRALLKEGRSLQDANLLAQQASNYNTANFARKGSWSKVVNTVIPFFSAGIAGARSLTRSAQANPAGFAVRFSTTIGLPTATATAWNISDPVRKQAYDDIASSEKENNLIIVPPNPVQDENGKWNVVKIPVTPGLSNLMSIVRRQVEGVHTVSPESALAILGDVAAAGTSINVSDPRKLASSYTPQAVKPGLEVALNKNLYSGRDVVPFYMKNLPPEDQVYDNTSGTAREIGRMLNASPLTVENAVGTSLAGVGRHALNASDRILNSAGLIPDEQIGGRSIGQDIESRFSKASGGEIERKQVDDEKKAEMNLGGGGQSVFAKFFEGQKAEAAESTPIVNNKVKYKDLDGKVQTIDLSPPTTGKGIDAFTNQDWNLTKAREVWKANMPEEDRNKAFEQLGVDPEEVRYDYLANHENDIKAQYIVSKNLDHDQLIERLISGRVESSSGKIFASDGVLDELKEQGLITPEEAKALKAMDLDKKGKPKAGTGKKGRKGKAVTIKSVSPGKISFTKIAKRKMPTVKISKAPVRTKPVKAKSVSLGVPQQKISYKIVGPSKVRNSLDNSVRLM